MPDKLEITTQIAAAYLGHNMIAASDVPGLIKSIHGAVVALGQPGAGDPEKKGPAVPIKKSIGENFIICLEDGKKLKMLKRYLRTQHNLTPEQYRAKWGLPVGYPMICPQYAKLRSAFAKQNGLGRVPGGKTPRGK